MTIQFMLLQNRQGKTRLTKWFTPDYNQKTKQRIIREIGHTVTSRSKSKCNFIEWRQFTIVYKRYASLFFIICIESGDNEILAMELIHQYVEVLDSYFGNVCELDLIFNFDKAHYMLDELVLGGSIQETSKREVIRCIKQQDDIEQKIREERGENKKGKKKKKKKGKGDPIHYALLALQHSFSITKTIMSLCEITLCNRELNGFIWSVHHANDLRTNYRILGNFNNHISKQNDQNKKRKITDKNMIIGVPFILNKFEIRLCFELKIASIVYKCIDENTFKLNNNKNSNNNKDDIIYQFFIENNLKRIESLKEKCQYQHNKTEIESCSIGQKRKLNETDVINDNEDKNQWDDIKELELLSTSNIINKVSKTEKSVNTKIHIAPSQNDFILFPNKLFNVYLFDDISNNYNPQRFWCKLFNFKASTNEYKIFEEEYRIYRDLYDKGFCIVIDRRFSGNFILYSKSPSLSSENKIHSKYIVQIISNYDINYKLMLNILDKYCEMTMEYDNNDIDQDTKLLELDIMIMCFVRIAVIVKKYMLFSYLDSKTNKIKYYIVKWHYYNSKRNENNSNKMDDNMEKEMWYQVYSDYEPSFD